MKNQQPPKLLNWNEAMKIIGSVDDKITEQLMSMASFEALRHLRNEDAVQMSADFDMLFFMKVMLSFCSDHENLRKVLSGEDLPMLPDSFD